MKLTNRYGLPDPVVRALTRNEYTRGESNRSVTQLIDSPRIRILRQENWDEMEEDCSEKLWAVLGTAAHKMFEDTADGSFVSEERIFTDVAGWTISGAIDVQQVHNDGSVTVMDYKTTSVWSVIYGKPEWELQLNCYAFLLQQKHVNVRALKVIAICRDWKAKEAEQKQDYPKAPIVEVDVALWDEERRKKYVYDRVSLHQNAEFNRLTSEQIRDCSPEEMWQKGDSWAVKKSGNKRAIRVFDSEEKAKAMLEPGLVIEHRPGERPRCAGDWCRVSRWCDQWKAFKEENGD